MPDIPLPRIIFGSSSLGNLYKALPDETKRALVAAWLKHCPGTVAIDSAGKYGAGLALESIGRQLTALGTPRDRVLISNKLAWRRAPLTGAEPTFEPGVWIGLEHDAVQDISGPGILRCRDEGDRLLGDYPAQLVSVHDPDEYLAAAATPAERASRLDDTLAAYAALAKLRDAGRVLGVGIGSKDWRVIRDIESRVKLDWVMFANSLTIHRHEDELLDYIDTLRAKGVAIVNSAVFHAGFLVGGAFYDYKPVDGSQPHHAALIDWRTRFHAVCAASGVTPAHACVAFSFLIPGIRSVALNTTRVEAVAENVRMTETPLPPAFWQKLAAENLITPRILAYAEQSAR